MPSETDELYKQLDYKHPDYDEWAAEWEVYRDVVGDVLVDTSRYLERNSMEAPSQYAFRQKLAEWIPETPKAIERLVGALYSQKPKRELGGTFDEFVANVDRKGSSLDVFVERVCRTMLTYGSTRVLVNVPRVDLDRPLTRADEIELGLRPFLINYTPLSVINWDVDPEGRTSMVLIKEQCWRKDLPTDPRSEHLQITRCIQYDVKGSPWWEFARIEGDQVLRDEGESTHDLGFVPMIVVSWPTEIRPFIGSSYIRLMSRVDKQLFRSQTDLDYDAYVHAHPTLKVWTDEQLKKVGVGSQQFLKLKPGGPGVDKEDASYMEVPESAFDVLKWLIEMRVDAVGRHAGIDPLGTIKPGSTVYQASGAARAWSFGTSEARVLHDVADTMTIFERQMFAYAGAYLSSTPVAKAEDVKIQYPRDFDMSATDTLVDLTERIAQLVNSPSLIRKLHKQIAASRVAESSAMELQAIFKEIDSRPLIGTPADRSASSAVVYDMPRLTDDKSGEKEEEEEKKAVAKPRSKTKRPAGTKDY